MPITTIAQYNSHLTAMAKRVLSFNQANEGDLSSRTFRDRFALGMDDFVLNGPTTIDGVATTQQNRRETSEMFATAISPGMTPHQRAHIFLDAGVDHAVPDIDRAEPVA